MHTFSRRWDVCNRRGEGWGRCMLAMPAAQPKEGNVWKIPQHTTGSGCPAGRLVLDEAAVDPEHEARWSEFCSRHRCDSRSRGSVYDSKAGICCHFCRQKKLCGEEGCQRCIQRDPSLPCLGALPSAGSQAPEWHPSRSLLADCRAVWTPRQSTARNESGSCRCLICSKP